MAFGAITFTAMCMSIGMLSLLPIALAEISISELPNFSGPGWVALIFLGAIGGALQFSVYTWALRWITPTRVSMYLMLNPISAILIAYPLLNEQVTLGAIGGLILVLFSIYLISNARRDP